MEKLDIKPKIEFSDRMRIWFKWFLDPVAAFFNRIGLTPNTMTLLGLAGNFAAAYFVSRGQISLGGLLMLLTTPFDALDGTMARLRGDASDWGAFVDSVTDRYSELAILGGLLVHFSTIGDGLSAIATFAAAQRDGAGLVRQGPRRGSGILGQSRLPDARRALPGVGPAAAVQPARHRGLVHRRLRQFHRLAEDIFRPRAGAGAKGDAGKPGVVSSSFFDRFSLPHAKNRGILIPLNQCGDNKKC
ncbi:MAG: CDP-alcohol phosphatidyltransferase family protein [Anaerolineales bacterium]|nr:CDP-alcohol phosphatidyltransferase family protein [Anaerolineales bacterium]